MNSTIESTETNCKTIPYFGLASGVGGSNTGSGQGPLVIQEELSDCRWVRMVSANPSISNRLEQVADANQALADTVYETAKTNSSLVMIGGDHSCAIGTWSGVAAAKQEMGEDIGLLWFDAHMDSHTVETSESGNPHGMPLAALLGYGFPGFTQILSPKPKIKPENLFLIGIRSYEPAERALLEKLNVRVYYIEEVLERGLKAILSEIFTNFANRKLSYGISLDIDFFDPSFMSATGTPEKNGADPQEFLENCALFKQNPPIAFEFVEFNPSLDSNRKSLDCVKKILDTMKYCLA